MAGAVFPETLGVDRIVVERRDSATGTFSLRRADYLRRIEQGMLSAEQQHALLELIKEGDFHAKQKAIACNLRLVAGIAMGYANRGMEFLELVSAGVIGLIQALEKSGQAGALRFQACARLYIREHIERALSRRPSIVS